LKVGRPLHLAARRFGGGIDCPRALDEFASLPVFFWCFSFGRGWPETRSREAPARFKAAAMVATGRRHCSRPTIFFSSFELDQRRPSVLRWTHEIRTYPFDGNLVKEPLRFLVNNPRSLAHSRKLRFHIWKAYFQPVKSKIRFQQFTVLPLELF
jgi:hypothetical protein